MGRHPISRGARSARLGACDSSARPAAGRDLGVAPSTIYRPIAALEEAAGFACLDRGKGITAAGRELAELARSTGSRERHAIEGARFAVRSGSRQSTASRLSSSLRSPSSPSRRLLVELVASGAGLGLLPVKLAAGLSELVELSSYRPSCADLARPAWLFMHPEVRRDARVAAVTKVLVEHLKA